MNSNSKLCSGLAPLMPLLLLLPASAGATLADSGLSPSAAFVQTGSGDRARELAVGLAWDWSLDRKLGPGVLTGYWELSLSRWTYPGTIEDRRPTWLGQVGFIPVLRYRPQAGTSPWFVEAGIGLTLMSKVYQTDGKRFSTSFNFGDHLAAGYTFGPQREHEIALRMEHFSNGGIKHPNPGENFIQLRYTLHFK